VISGQPLITPLPLGGFSSTTPQKVKNKNKRKKPFSVLERKLTIFLFFLSLSFLFIT